MGGRARQVGTFQTCQAAARRLWVSHAALTVTVGLAVAVGAAASASATTIKVTEKGESATFVHGGKRPKNYADEIRKISNHNGRCSLREAIKAANTDKKVDSCRAGSGRDVIELPAGVYPVSDNLFVLAPVTFRGANAGRPGNDPNRGPETIIKLVDNPDSVAQPALFWLGLPSPSGPAKGGGSVFDGLTLAGDVKPSPECVANSGAYCEEWAIVQPEKSGGGADTAPGFKLRNSIVRDFTAGVYLGGEAAVIARNLFRDNQALIDLGPGAAGVDVYSDGVYTNIDPRVVGNVFANPRIAAVELQGVGGDPLPVSGGLIRNNLINLKNGDPYFAILLLATHGQRIQDNVIRDPSPPPVQTLCCTDGIHLDAVHDVEINGNDFNGLAAALRISELIGGSTGVHGVRATHNRIYGNAHGIRVFGAYPAGSLDARANWWGANGGAGSNGARPGAPNPVNDVWFGHIEFPPGGGFILVQDPPPDPNWIDASEPLQLGCSLPGGVTVGSPTPFVGTSTGVPSFDLPATQSPLFTKIAMPTMDASLSGVAGSISGFGKVPSTGFRRGQAVPGGGRLEGQLTATSAGSGVAATAMDSEQVPCPFTAVPADIAIDKSADRATATLGQVVHYTITVRNRGRAAVRRLRACDRSPRGLLFVRSNRRLRRVASRKHCLVVGTLGAHRARTFRITMRVSPTTDAFALTNDATAEINGRPPAVTPGARPSKPRDHARIRVRRPIVRCTAVPLC